VTLINDNSNVFETILDRSSHVNPVDDQGNTPLHQVCDQSILTNYQIDHLKSKRVESSLMLLCQRGADLYAVNDQGKTPLDIAQCKSPVAQRFFT
jgi:ankyrin repeat protein